MRKFTLLLVLVLFNSFAIGQRTGHSHLSLVSNVYFNDDYSKFLTQNLNEIGHWDAVSMKPIWLFDTKNFGCDYTGNFWNIIPHANLDYFSMVGHSSCNKLIDVKKLIYNPSTSTNLYWVNGKVKIIYADSEKDKWLVYCYDANSNEKKVIHKDKTMNMSYCIFEGKIYVSDLKKNITKRYDIATEKWDDYTIDIGKVKSVTKNYIEYLNGFDPYVYDLTTKKHLKIDLGSYEVPYYKLRGREYCLVNANNKEAFFYDIPTATKSIIKIIFKHQNKNDIKFIDYDGNKKVLYFVENEATEINSIYMVKSFLSSYDKEGNHLNSILLTETNNDLIVAIDKKADIEAEKRRVEEELKNTPENRLRIRLSNLYNQKFINTTNKRIYQVVPDKPIYEGNLVRMNALHHDKTKIEEVYERLENLENPSKYTSVKQFGKCNVCQGEGVTHKSGTSTVADYEYTLGVKVVKTTTTSSGCEHCGGSGLIQK